nr:uncharacterized protein LOC101736528 isoform X2 [Bombyx mori]
MKPVSEEKKSREQRLQTRNLKKQLFSLPNTSHYCEDIVPLEEHSSVHFDSNVSQEILIENNKSSIDETITRHHITIGTQTSNILRLFSTELLLADDETVQYYTGLETASKFSLVLITLLPMANDIRYRWSRVVGISIEDQFLMLLIKLRRNTTDFELSKIFGVSKTEVSNIVVTWINFVSDIWSLIDIWPSRSLVNYYMPNCFRTHYPSTRVIIDGTEIGIQKPSQPDTQKASFSSYKHKNTLKFLVGASPGGLLTYVSNGYAGSASDRQIVERSKLLQICDSGDSIMADRGFNVQDLFASKGISINIPSFLKGKSQIPGVQLKIDQKLASQRVHIERLIGLTKTYLILKNELNHFYVPLASKIFFICVMLCNFREGIVNKNN